MTELTRQRTGWLVAIGIFVVGLFVLIAANLDLASEGLVSHAKAAEGAQGHAPEARPAAAEAAGGEAKADDGAAKDPDAALRDLSCFGCHDLKAYHEGNKKKAKAGDDEDDDDEVIGKPFSHDFHADEVGGHCHKCHAFKGHFEVVVREDTCGECH